MELQSIPQAQSAPLTEEGLAAGYSGSFAPTFRKAGHLLLDNSVDIAHISWTLALQRANYQTALAHDLLRLLIEFLPQVTQRVQRLLDGFEVPDIGFLVHKLHGGTLYSGVPNLCALCCFLESQLQLGVHPRALTESWLALLAECRAIEQEADFWLAQPSSSTVATA